MSPERHYSYTFYADPATARAFDNWRFSGPIGELVASNQADVLLAAFRDLRDRSVLDVGTGTGRAALLLARHGGKVVGVDASEEMLTVARLSAAQEAAEVKFQIGDAHALEFPDRAFDAAISLRVLMHTPDWVTCLRELCRVSNDVVIVDFPSARSLARLESTARRAGYRLGLSAEPYRVLALPEVEQVLSTAGFRVRVVHRLFVLPIAFHKRLGSRRVTETVEGWLARLGLLRIFGSPITVVAERCASS